ncbi:hypothetical protein OOT33_00855 [Sphingobium sp. DEHP117]|uniref:fimbrial biogenesis chaperone n=1 Tax=Sphingobium sp. DEHP117 TaxID=2993436 RepID=UPI0027D5ADBA|nr:hypothetical protein [Sphingobium sp. DEHP117]MDQ4418997.1 hypothetical protein [Sphingobium sp. DEHP117]
MKNRILNGLSVCSICIASALPSSAWALGDLLVAPTRVVMADNTGAEVILNNKGRESATYRVSLVIKKMLPDGQLEDVVEPSAEQQQALSIISYAPRKVVLAPGQSQTVRLGAHAPIDLPDGEYRVHMLFRAIPDADPAARDVNAQASGLSIMLTPVYGVSIPVITRKGELEAQAKIENIRVERDRGRATLLFDLARSGNRSISGTVLVSKAGSADPLAEVKGVSAYREVDRRTVAIDLGDRASAQLKGLVTVSFREDSGSTSAPVITEARASL